MVHEDTPMMVLSTQADGSLKLDLDATLKKARMEEREACAKIADMWARTIPVSGPAAKIIASAVSSTAASIAERIRKRIET